jgi:arginine:agmatine antiporter
MQTGIVYWFLCATGNVAVALAVTGYLGFFLPQAASGSWLLLTTLAVLVAATVLNLLGARAVAGVAALALAAGLAPIALAIAVGIPEFSFETLMLSWNPSGEPLAKTVPASLALIFWAYLGLETGSFSAAVVRNPERNLPIAVVGGVGLAAVVYISSMIVMMGVIPADELSRSTAPFADMVGKIMGPTAGAVVAACAMFKAFGTLSGATLATAETGRSSAVHGFWPRSGSSGPHAAPPIRDVLVVGAMMVLTLFASTSPTLGEQFALIAEISVLLTMMVYVYCCFVLLRWSGELGSLRARLLAWIAAVVGGGFCVWLTASAGTKSLLASLVVVVAAVVVGVIFDRLNRKAPPWPEPV